MESARKRFFHTIPHISAAAIARQTVTAIVNTSVRTTHLLGRAIVAAGSYLGDLIIAMAEARAKDMQINRSPW